MNRKHHIILSLSLLAYLLIILIFLPVSASYQTLSFATDAKEYLAVGSEFFDFDKTGYSNIRPFLYPLFVHFLYAIGGAKLIWVVQLLAWIISGNLVYASLVQFTKKHSYAILGIIIFAGNLSLIALTYHALTEVITVLLLSFLIAVLAFQKDELKTTRTFLKLCFLFVLLTVVKPLFFIPLILFLGFSIFFYWKSFKQAPKQLILAIVVLFPLLLQLTVMKVKYNKFTVSFISEITLDRYLFTQGITEMNGISRDSALVQMEGMAKSEKRAYFGAHLGEYSKLFFSNLKFNISAHPTFLSMSKETTNENYVLFMKVTNRMYLHVFRIFCWLNLAFFLYCLLKKKILKNLSLLTLVGFNYYLFYTSAISFSQGDRLVLPALVVWITVYLVLSHQLIEKTKQFIAKRKTAA